MIINDRSVGIAVQVGDKLCEMLEQLRDVAMFAAVAQKIGVERVLTGYSWGDWHAARYLYLALCRSGAVPAVGSWRAVADDNGGAVQSLRGKGADAEGEVKMYHNHVQLSFGEATVVLKNVEHRLSRARPRVVSAQGGEVSIENLDGSLESISVGSWSVE